MDLGEIGNAEGGARLAPDKQEIDVDRLIVGELKMSNLASDLSRLGAQRSAEDAK